MWKLILISSAFASQVIDSGDDVALRGHLANLIRLDRDRARQSGAPRPRLEGDGEVVFSNGTRGVVKFEPVAVRQTQPVIPVGSVVVPFRAAA